MHVFTRPAGGQVHCRARGSLPHKTLQSWTGRAAAPKRRWRACATVQEQQGAAAGAEERLLAQLARLGFPAGILPGADRQGREELDSLVAALEAGTPTPHPLGHGGSPPDPLLFCAWRLVYASNGTVVTRTPAAQALVAASGVPGVGLKDVVQQLELDADGTVRTTNSAVFGLFVFGEWAATILGTWTPESGTLARVAFQAYSVQLVGAFGWRPLRDSLKVTIPLPESARQRTAEFETTYLSQQLRIARGSTGNVFVFSRASDG